MSFDGKCLLAGFFSFCALFRVGFGTELIIEVPQAALKGHEVVLKCLYDLEGDKLYSLKWYHNSAEFYRYTSTGKNQLQLFNLKGFHIAKDKSNATQVVLKHVTRAINGQYSCEVTEDQPSFYTLMKTKFLEVVDPPVSDPIVVGTKSRYKIGDYIKATCWSDKSDPAVNMTWYVNGRPIEGPYVRKYRKTVEGNYTSSYSTLQLSVTELLFEEGKLKIRCNANIYDVWQRTVEKTIEIRKNKQLDDSNYAPGWMASTTSTELPHEKYWLYVARDGPETTEWSGNSNSSSICLRVTKAIILVTIIVCVR